MSSFSNSCEVTAMLSIVLGFFVLIKGHRKSINLYWALFCFSVASWSYGLGMMVKAADQGSALFWLRYVHYVGAIMIPIFFTHFVSLYLGIRIKRILILGYALAGVQQRFSVNA